MRGDWRETLLISVLPHVFILLLGLFSPNYWETWETTVLVSGLECINTSALFPKMDLVHYLFYNDAKKNSVFSLNI